MFPKRRLRRQEARSVNEGAQRGRCQVVLRHSDSKKMKKPSRLSVKDAASAEFALHPVQTLSKNSNVCLPAPTMPTDMSRMCSHQKS